MAESIGYGSQHRYRLPYFNGDSDKYELWEEKFMGYLRIKKLKKVITSTSATLPEGDIDKNDNADGGE